MIFRLLAPVDVNSPYRVVNRAPTSGGGGFLNMIFLRPPAGVPSLLLPAFELCWIQNVPRHAAFPSTMIAPRVFANVVWYAAMFVGYVSLFAIADETLARPITRWILARLFPAFAMLERWRATFRAFPWRFHSFSTTARPAGVAIHIHR